MSEIALYRRPDQMEPLLLTDLASRAASASMATELDALSFEIIRQAGRLEETLPSRTARRGIASLVQKMNSYYSNLIEGHKILPKDIERALKSGPSGSDENQKNQRLSLAHIEAETAMRQWLREDPELNVFSADFFQRLHKEFYSHLPESDLVVEDKKGNHSTLVPGAFRDYQVSVGAHEPPDHATLDAFMQAYETRYSSPHILPTQKLIALAAAHHRFVWIHPFGDGNGRVSRLQSQAAIIRLGLDGEGLWTLSRGLARQREQFQNHLQAADEQRTGSMDGRGNLSERRLAEFCRFYLRTILDQMEFMHGLIAPATLSERIAKYVELDLFHLDARMKERLIRLLQYLCKNDEIPRGQVPELLGGGGTTAREVIRTATELELITSDSEKKPLYLNFPTKVTEFYFPGLFTDLPPG